ncbi:PREDICTED: vomeronasal type-1 receptor 4-like [Chinchilla lanigera]|uniref:vomeronasal type-1 receptor 4-like n=1 Tax=Chinchilla lanigera TaxID=34839 RepID=UPI000695CAEB|nr:PREDICTED: vomeronasal type-1 receptor 4-like [Chinchilla lanigera]
MKNELLQVILIHLVVTNILMLVSQGIPRTIADFGIRNFLDDTGCKIVCYLHRVARGLSICTSSLLIYKSPPEVKATQSVLLLMLCFVFFYWTDCVFALFTNSFLENNFMLFNIRNFVTLGYAVVSPFVLIHRDGHLGECWRAL